MNILTVGAGIYGCTIARLLTNSGNDVKIIDKRPNIGGNCYDKYMEENYYVHVYGPHVFHTSNEEVWTFVNKYTKFNNYIHKVIARDDNNISYSLPFNLMTFSQILGTTNYKKIQEEITKDIKENNISNPVNLEEQAISMVGKKVFEKLIKNYTEKQWNKKCYELSNEIIKRLPIRYTFNDNYFNDKYQGIPINGYTELCKNILLGTENEKPIDNIELNTKFNLSLITKYDRIIYCGSVDELLDYKYGTLPYRSLEFKDEIYKFSFENSEGIAQTNFVGKEINATRVTDHVYFYPENIETHIGQNVIKTYEFPVNYTINKEKFYSINTKENNALYNKYVDELKTTYPNIILGGRLGKYMYLDMDKAILCAFKDFTKFNIK